MLGEIVGKPEACLSHIQFREKIDLMKWIRAEELQEKEWLVASVYLFHPLMEMVLEMSGHVLQRHLV